MASEKATTLMSTVPKFQSAVTEYDVTNPLEVSLALATNHNQDKTLMIPLKNMGMSRSPSVMTTGTTGVDDQPMAVVKGNHIQKPEDFSKSREQDLTIGMLQKHEHQNMPSPSPHHHDDTVPLTLRVCTQCHHALLGAFDHCLAKHGEPTPLESIHLIDEVQDAVQTSEAPYFDIVKDPTRNIAPFELTQVDQIERDRWVLQQKKQAVVKEEADIFGPGPVTKKSIAGAEPTGTVSNLTTTKASSIPPNTSEGVMKGHVFSGALYKRMLDRKDREIAQLRQQLYDTMKKEQYEAANVQKLRVALNRSVQYYAFAEEWQQSESSRLQEDVRFLKAEASSLMAFLIHSEEEKRKLHREIDRLQNVISSRDEQTKSANKAVEEMKAKLHDSFKEFMAMDQTMDRLKREAQKGTEAAEARNTILQRNLDKLAVDFESNAKDLTAAQTKIRELEFELEELVQQFNVCGEAKRKTEELNVRIVSELDHANQSLDDLRQNHEQALLQKAKLEADLRKAEMDLEEANKDHETQMTRFIEELDQLTAIRKDLENQLKTNKADNEKLTTALKNITRAKDQLETNMRVMTQKHEKELAIRDAKVRELLDHRAEDAKIMKRQQDQKEQVMFQLAELQSQLERETNNLNVMTFELNQLKRQSEEKASLLDEQIEKLNAARSNLSNDKRQLSEKIKLLRADLRVREEELETVRNTFSQHRDNASQMEADLRKQLADSQNSYANLTSELKSLENKHSMVLDSSVKLKLKHDTLTKKHATTETVLAETTTQLNQFREENATLKANLQSTTESYTITKTELDMATQKVAELSSALSTLQTESEERISTRNADIARLSSTLYKAQQDNQRLNESIRTITINLSDMDRRFKETSEKLVKETAQRELLETQLHKNRLAYDAERRLRVEFERIQVRGSHRDTTKDLETLGEFRKRDRMLNGVSAGLKSECDRLTTLSGLLPTAKDLGKMELANTKEFGWLFENESGHKNSKSARESENHRPRRSAYRRSRVSKVSKPPALAAMDALAEED